MKYIPQPDLFAVNYYCFHLFRSQICNLSIVNTSSPYLCLIISYHRVGTFSVVESYLLPGSHALGSCLLSTAICRDSGSFFTARAGKIAFCSGVQ